MKYKKIILKLALYINILFQSSEVPNHYEYNDISIDTFLFRYHESNPLNTAILVTASFDHQIKFWMAHSGDCFKTIQYQDSVSII